MADLASSAVSLQPASLGEAEFWMTKRRGLFSRRIKLTGVTQGGATNRLTASALGFTKVVDCGNFHDTTSGKVQPAVVDPVNNIVLLGAGAANAIGDVTATTGYIVVTGY